MSTTFDVYPNSSQIPSFNQLLELATYRMQQQLLARGVSVKPELTLTLLRNATHEVLPLNLASPAKWKDSEYAWFTVKGVFGGTDVSIRKIDSDELAYWEEITSEHPKAMTVKEEVLACLFSGTYWSFRRSAGQPGVIAFAYGILAASLAELTDGFVYSDDSAWDYERFPAKAHEFYEWYFKPEEAIDQNLALWAESCLAGIESECNN